MANNLDSFKAKLSLVAWDFSNVENRGLHLAHWYPATFVSAIPGSLVPLVARKGDLVVDPFCGAGATVVEAVRLGRRALGFDTNPVALLISAAKLALPSQRSLSKLRQLVAEAGQRSLVTRMIGKDSNVPHLNAVELRQWYHSATYEELLQIQGSIESLPNGKLKTVGRCIFSSILKNVCSQGRHWGWVCDNVKPKRAEIQEKDALGAYLAALDEFSRGLKEFANDMRNRGLDPDAISRGRDWDVRSGDACKQLRALEPHSVDAIVTSPPYHGVADYVKSQRLTFLWYPTAVAQLEGLNGGFEQLRKEEIGSRSHRHRQGSFEDYVGYMKKFLGESVRVLKPGAALCLVIGDSGTRKPTTSHIMQAADAADLKLVFSSNRDIRATRRRMQASVPHESILIYVKIA